ncbi:MAG: S8 family serine peptidase, partial [Elusimicrobia bacterium]|nr:S8 family serine peptidase [Elusimicrobiota bacterium]
IIQYDNDIQTSGSLIRQEHEDLASMIMNAFPNIVLEKLDANAYTRPVHMHLIERMVKEDATEADIRLDILQSREQKPRMQAGTVERPEDSRDSKEFILYCKNLESDEDLIRIVDRINNLGSIDNIRIQAFPNTIHIVCGIPNDQKFNEQWALHNTGQNGGTPDADIDAPEAWDITEGDDQVVIAIVDTGVDYNHEDLENKIWINEDEIPNNNKDDDNNGFIDDRIGYDFVSVDPGQVYSGEDPGPPDNDPMDFNGHGTHCSGIAAAETDNTVGIAGVAPKCRIMCIRAGYEDSDGYGVLQNTDIEQAIQYAIDNGADVISMSFGNTWPYLSYADEIETAYRENIVCVAAAGNYGSYSMFYPAAFPEVIAVAATDNKDARSVWGNYSSNMGPWIDLAAPGSSILSTVPYRISSNGYYKLGGTSMACPHVAGAAALLRSLKPAFTNEEIKSAVKMKSDPINPDYYIGQGRLNIEKMLNLDTPNLFAAVTMDEQIFGTIDIKGTAKGQYFDHYTLYYGEGLNPSEWIEIHSSNEPVENGVLFSGFNTLQLSNKYYMFQVVVTDIYHNSLESGDGAYVSNKVITYPLSGDIIKPTQPGEYMYITAETQEYPFKVEYGMGFDPQVWTDQGILLTPGSPNSIARWDTSGVIPNEFYNLKLTLTTEVGDIDFYSEMFYFEPRLKDGFPLYIKANCHHLDDDQEFIPADLDGDGFKEIITHQIHSENYVYDNDYLVVYDHRGNEIWRHQFYWLGHLDFDVTVGNIDDDPYQEIVMFEYWNGPMDDSLVWAFNHDGTVCSGWPVPIDGYHEGLMIVDLDHDGKNEVIASSRKMLYIIDGQGTIRQTIDPHATLVPGVCVDMAVGNFDEDSDLEIVKPTDHASLAVYN